MTPCGACGYQNEAGAEFCASCGTFLEWTGGTSAPGAAEAAAVRATAVADLDPRTVGVAPGEATAVRVTAHNRGPVHTEFTAEVSGVPAGWAAFEPPGLALFPDDRGSLTLWFRPPRASSPPAGSLPYRVVLRPVSGGDERAAPITADGVVELAPFVDLSVDVAPPTSVGRLAGRHTVTVHNGGNMAVTATVRGHDPEARLRFPQPAAVSAAPGANGQATLTAKPGRWNWFGPPRQHKFEVVVEADGMEGATTAAMEQRRIGWWPLVVLVVMILLVVLLVAR